MWVDLSSRLGKLVFLPMFVNLLDINEPMNAAVTSVIAGSKGKQL